MRTRVRSRSKMRTFVSNEPAQSGTRSGPVNCHRGDSARRPGLRIRDLREPYRTESDDALISPSAPRTANAFRDHSTAIFDSSSDRHPSPSASCPTAISILQSDDCGRSRSNFIPTFGSETTGHGTVRSTIAENEDGAFVTANAATANMTAPNIIRSPLRRSSAAARVVLRKTADW